MQLKRHFFISDDLDDLEKFEEELERADIVKPQIHVLTLDDAGAADHHNLHEVTSLMKTDLLHSLLLGALAGLVAAAFILILAHLAGWTQSPAGWIPFVFLAVCALGFFTWEGGLWGIDTPNVHFRNFEKALKEGKHVFFVDLEPGRGKVVRELVQNHPTVKPAGTARGAPHWIVRWQHGLKRFFTETFP